ncbi:hypothetical protein Tco_1458031 [Tanacetum coccineum]
MCILHLSPLDSELICSQTYLRLTISPNVWSSNSLRLVPSCCMILDLELLSLSFNFVIDSKIFKSFPWFPAQSVGSSNTEVLDTPCLLDLFIGTSQSRQHVNTSLIHIESRKSPTAVLFDDDTGRISIHQSSR